MAGKSAFRQVSCEVATPKEMNVDKLVDFRIFTSYGIVGWQ